MFKFYVKRMGSLLKETFHYVFDRTTSCEVNLFWDMLLLNRRFGWSKPLSRPKITTINLKYKNLKISYLVFHKITTIQKYMKITENIKATKACASINLLLSRKFSSSTLNVQGERCNRSAYIHRSLTVINVHFYGR